MGSTICPMSEIVCFPVLNFTYSHVENSLFFALDSAVSLWLEFTFQTYQLVYYNLFVIVSSIAKISFILFVSCFVKQHPGWNCVLLDIYDCEILSLRCLIGPMFYFVISYVIPPDGHFRTRPRNLADGVTILIWLDGQVYRAQYILFHSNSYQFL